MSRCVLLPRLSARFGMFRRIHPCHFFFVSNRHSNSLLYGKNTILFYMSFTQYSVIPYGYIQTMLIARTVVCAGVCCICVMEIVAPKKRSMGCRRGQKPSLFLVVAGGGLEVCSSPVRPICGIFCFENPYLSRFVFLTNRYSISLSYG